MSEVAVKGCTVEIKSGQEAGNINITTSPSSYDEVDDKGIYFGSIDVSLTNITQGNLLCPSGTITINGTASNVLDGGDNKAVQKGDSATKTLTFTDQTSGAPSDIPVTIEVTDANQSYVFAT